MATRSPLRRLRQDKGLTLAQLSERIKAAREDATGTSVNNLAAIERLERPASPETLRAILDAIDAGPPMDLDIELQDDLHADLDVLHAEAEMLHEGIQQAALRIGEGVDRELHLRLVVHGLRRQRAILAALRIRTAKPS